MLVKMNVDADLVDTIKRFAGETVASKAFFSAACRAIELQNRADRLDKQVAKLTLEREFLRDTIRDAHSAAKALIERTGQDDIFID